MDNENCSIKVSKLLSSLGMVSMEAVFDPPDIIDLWKVRILPGGPVFENGFAIPIENTWSVVAEVAIDTVCSALSEKKEKEREYYKEDDVIKYIEI